MKADLSEHAKLDSIQALRAISSLFVVWIHLTAIERKYGAGATIIPSWLTHGIAEIDVFFVLSGLVLVVATQGKFGSVQRFTHFIFNRFVRIYPLYWLYSAIALIVYLINPTLVNSAQGNRVDVLASFLLLPSEFLPLINVAWMLVHIVYFYLVFGLFVLFLKENFLPIALGIWAIALGVGQAYCAGGTCSPTLALISHPYTFEFIAGCGIGILIQRSERRYARIALSASVLFIAGALVILNPLPHGVLVTEWNRMAAFGVPAILLVYGLVALEAQNKFRAPRLFRAFGDASYSIYLSHVPLLALMGLVWSQFSTSNLTEHFIVLFLMTLAVVVFGMFSYRFIEQPLLRALRRWGDANLGS